MDDNLLTLPADAPAAQAWRLLWELGIDGVSYPAPDKTAGELVASLSPSLQRLVYHRITETAQEGTAS